MGRKIDRQKNLENAKRRRNKLLLIAILPTVVLVLSAAVLLGFQILHYQEVVSIIFPLMLINLFWLVIRYSPKVLEARMYVDYYNLVLNEPKVIKPGKRLFTESWINGLKKSGYKVAQEHFTHVLLFRVFGRGEVSSGSEETVVFINIAKQNDFDLYSEEVDHAMQDAYRNNVELHGIGKQITLQFKKYETNSDQVQEEVESAIVYSDSKQRMISLTTAYLEDVESVLMLDPGERYADKYMFFAFKELRRMCGIKVK